MRPLDSHDLLEADIECDFCQEPPEMIDDATGWVACARHAEWIAIDVAQEVAHA